MEREGYLMGQMGFLISLSGGSQEVFLHLSLESLKGFPVGPETLTLDDVRSL